MELLKAGDIKRKLLSEDLHPDNISYLNGFASIWCSVENIFLAATAEGYACAIRE